MAEDVAQLTYGLLKRMNGTLHSLALDVADLKPRMTSLEGQMGQVIGMIGHLESQHAATSARLDRLDERIARIERRLDLIEA